MHNSMQRNPCGCWVVSGVRMTDIVVVGLPEPRKPLSIVTGVFLAVIVQAV
jgi:hypothetical protein